MKAGQAAHTARIQLPRSNWVLLPLSLLPLAFLAGLWALSGATFNGASLLADWILILFVLGTAWIQAIPTSGKAGQILRRTGAALGALAGVTALGYLLGGWTVLAWVALAASYAVLIRVDRLLSAGQGRVRRFIIHLFLACLAGLTPVAVVQLQSHFAEEEFFVALQAVALAGFWALLLWASGFLKREADGSMASASRQPARLVSLALVSIVLAGLAVTLWSYQRSFYPGGAPGYPGITERNPFLCGQASPDPQTYDGRQVFQKMLTLVAANPDKAAPELGMLALGLHDPGWAESFRAELLSEAEQGLFTRPANSVKSVQYEAALRVYYYARMRQAFPGLFSPAEQQKLQGWFAAINRRALTVEWVDWFYALAFSKFPEGPYENQENGAGLLALLQVSGLADPADSQANQAYLERNRRGWIARFRNTDDVLVYQPEWIYNALFQSMVTGESHNQNQLLSFEWLLLQALPDGAALGYNHPASAPLAGIAYLGARLTGDAAYAWLAGRSLDAFASQGKTLSAKPGVEAPVDMIGRSPSQGSCLIYGDSGLPNQKGPLAPDKIVFRDGWSPGSAYLMLNLRFSGWHRYKATNAVTLFYQSGPLASEEMSGKTFEWLPTGRSLFRDKRIPRENLNGLLVERTGLDAVLYHLTGFGGPWAQDPPYYARVENFETGPEMDHSSTIIEGWHGWDQRRTVYFYHDGPAVILDDARGPAGQHASLAWHSAYAGAEAGQDRRFLLRAGVSPAEMVLVPLDQDKPQVLTEINQGESPELNLQYQSGETGRLRLATVFLTGGWVGARVDLVRSGEAELIQIRKGEKQLQVPLTLSNERSEK